MWRWDYRNYYYKSGAYQFKLHLFKKTFSNYLRWGKIFLHYGYSGETVQRFSKTEKVFAIKEIE